MTGIYLLMALMILCAAFVGWNVYRSLKMGEATLQLRTVSREDDRAFFWIYICLKIIGIALLLYIAALFLALAFPQSHISIWPMTQCSPYCGATVDAQNH